MQGLNRALAQKTHVLWDWNGTLLDDIDLCVEVIGELLTRYDLPLIDREIYRARFGFPVRAYYERIGFDFSRTPFETVAAEFVAAYNARVERCSLFPDAKDLIQSLSREGRTQAILSAAHEVELMRLTGKHGLKEWLAHVYGLPDHYAAGKIARGKELITALGANPKDCVLVGDTIHDAEVAEALGIDVILLGDGHQVPSQWDGKTPSRGCTVVTSRNSPL